MGYTLDGNVVLLYGLERDINRYPVMLLGEGPDGLAIPVQVDADGNLIVDSGGGGVTYPITPDKGGTGVANNASSTITISGNFGITFTVIGTTALTFPMSGTVATTATFASPPAIGSGTPAAITGTAISATSRISVASSGGSQSDLHIGTEDTGFSSSTGVLFFFVNGTVPWFSTGGASAIFGPQQASAGQFIAGSNTTAGRVCFLVNNADQSGLGPGGAAGQASLVATGVDRVIASATGTRLIGIPTSNAGLVSGDVYSTAGALMIVP